MDAHKHLGVVMDGNGKILSVHPGENEGESGGPAMRAWQEAQVAWEAASPEARPTDPPMWDLYQNSRRTAGIAPPS